MNLEEAKIVMVEWHDARLFTQPKSEEEVRDCRMLLFASVGYLVSQDDTAVIIAAEYNEEKQYREITLIPTGSVRRIRRLVLGSHS